MKRTIFVKVLTATLIPLILIFSMIVVTINNIIYESTSGLAENTATLFSMETSKRIKDRVLNLETVLDITAKNILDIDSKSDDARERVEHLVKTLLISNPNFYNAWVVFEPNAFDHKDSTKGRFAKSYISNDGVIKEVFDMPEEILKDPMKSPWYHVTLDTEHVFIEDAMYYDYLDGNGEKYVSSVSLPIRVNGKAIGCVGIDVLFNDMFSFIDTLQIPEERNVMIVSSEGHILYSYNNIYEGRNITEHSDNKKEHILNALKENLPFTGEDYSKLLQTNAFIQIYPIELENVYNPIFLSVVIPTSTINDKASVAEQKIITVSILGMIILVVSVFFTTRSIIRPIKEITKNANDIANGNYDFVFNENEDINDEVDILRIALKKMIDQLNTNIVTEREDKKKMQLYYEMLDIVQDTIDTDKAFSLVAKYIAKVLGFERVKIILYTDADFNVLANYLDEQTQDYVITEEELQCIYDIVKAERSIIIKDTLSNDSNVLSACAIPLNENESYYGFIFIESLAYERPVTEDKKEQFIYIGKIVSNLVIRKQIEIEREEFALMLESKIEQRTRQLKLMTIEAEKAKEYAETATKAKTQFLANMSHEIRTPMNVILGMSELLLTEELNSRQKSFVNDIMLSSTALLGIINDILDLSKLESGKLELNLIHYDFGMLIENVLSIISFMVKDKDLEFNYKEIGTMPDCLYGDDIRLRQILINILSNAVKFTKKGSVEFIMIDEGENLRFKITDTGIGIHKEDISRLFTPFKQMDTNKNRYIKGTGLGLSISKELVEMMGGTICVESEYGQGTVFTITLPKVLGDAKLLKSTAEIHVVPKAPQAKILVVDDNDINLNVASGLLMLSEINCDTANSAAEAIHMIKQTEYDIVFMDHMMPEMDGVEATKIIRDLGGEYQKTPIIALTANAISGAKEVFISAGMNDFLSKPIEREKLNEILLKWIPKNKMILTEKTDHSKNTMNQESINIIHKMVNIKQIDVELGLNRVRGMEDVYERSLKMLTKKIPSFCESMRELLNRKDLHTFLIEVHGMKGALANIGATLLSDQAMALEKASNAEEVEYCNGHLEFFLEELLQLSNNLNEVLFTENEPSLKPVGNTEFFIESLHKLENALSNFDYDLSVNIINELNMFSYGEAYDENLMTIIECINEFNYDEALNLIGNIIFRNAD